MSASISGLLDRHMRSLKPSAAVIAHRDEGRVITPMADATAIVRHLLQRGVLHSSDVINGNFKIVPISQRNLNFKVLVGQGKSYIVKYPRGHDSWSSLETEAEMYGKLESLRQGPDPLLWPRLRDYDTSRHIVVLELIPSAVSLTEYHSLARRSSVTVAGRLGQALATLHARARALVDPASHSNPPWILSIHRPEWESLPYLPHGVV